MELNKEYVISSENIQEIMFNVSEFITLMEKFKTFNINKDYNVDIIKEDNLYTAKMMILNENKDSTEGTI
jgi:hypothetical protein